MSRWVVGTVMAGALAVTAAGCRPQNGFVAPPPPVVTVAQPLERDVVDYFQTTGETRAVAKVELRAQVSGYLKEIHFEDGQTVEKGQLLFVIDPHRYQAAVNSAKAALLKAEAQEKLATAQLGRTRALVERKAGTKEQLDEAEAELASAKADVASANSAISRAQLDLGFTEIKAPFAGRMGRHEVDLGNLVEVGTTRLATLESVSPVHVYFTMNEADMLRFMEPASDGSARMIGSGPKGIELALGTGDDFSIGGGRLDFGEFGVDPATGTTLRRAVFGETVEDGKVVKGLDPRLVPGLFVRVRAAVGAPRPRVLVEERAISSDQRGTYVLVVNEKKDEPAGEEGEGKPAAAPPAGQPPAGAPAAGGQPSGEPAGPRYVVEYRPVKLGRLDAGLRVVEQGLTGKEWVVINGLQRARPGTEVKPDRAEMTPPAEGPPVAFRVLPAGEKVAWRNGGKAE